MQGGGTDTEQESAHKVDSGEENSPAAPAGIRARNLSITSLLPTSCAGWQVTLKHTHTPSLLDPTKSE